MNYNKTGQEKLLIPHKLSNGYLGILLFDDNKKHHNLLIHRLVALAFIPNPISKENKLIQEFPSISEAARIINNGNIKAAKTNILKCCNGIADTQFGRVQRNTAYGYIWKFK